MVKERPEPFTVVGSKDRCPYMDLHPDCWELPYQGIVLSSKDPIVWRNTLAFPEDRPDPLDVAKYVEDYNFEKTDEVPVMWYFWDNDLIRILRPRIYWVKYENLETYDYILEWWNLQKIDAESKLES